MARGAQVAIVMTSDDPAARERLCEGDCGTRTQLFELLAPSVGDLRLHLSSACEQRGIAAACPRALASIAADAGGDRRGALCQAELVFGSSRSGLRRIESLTRGCVCESELVRAGRSVDQRAAARGAAARELGERWLAEEAEQCEAIAAFLLPELASCRVWAERSDAADLGPHARAFDAAAGCAAAAVALRRQAAAVLQAWAAVMMQGALKQQQSLGLAACNTLRCAAVGRAGALQQQPALLSGGDAGQAGRAPHARVEGSSCAAADESRARSTTTVGGGSADEQSHEASSNCAWGEDDRNGILEERVAATDGAAVAHDAQQQEQQERGLRSRPRPPGSAEAVLTEALLARLARAQALHDAAVSMQGAKGDPGTNSAVGEWLPSSESNPAWVPECHSFRASGSLDAASVAMRAAVHAAESLSSLDTMLCKAEVLCSEVAVPLASHAADGDAADAPVPFALVASRLSAAHARETLLTCFALTSVACTRGCNGPSAAVHCCSQAVEPSRRIPDWWARQGPSSATAYLGREAWQLAAACSTMAVDETSRTRAEHAVARSTARRSRHRLRSHADDLFGALGLDLDDVVGMSLGR